MTSYSTHHTKRYSELKNLKTFEERFEYLKLGSGVGEDTFGFDRYLNQNLYRSKEWKDLRNKIILRDCGCDLGAEGYDIPSNAIIHHLNPITVEDVKNNNPCLFDPENLITTTLRTHNAIHYGTDDSFAKPLQERSMNDTCPWRK